MIYMATTEKERFEAIAAESKRFIVCKWGDFKVGDLMALNEEECYEKTGRSMMVRINYILPWYEYAEGIAEGYCVLSVKPVPVDGAFIIKPHATNEADT